MSLILLIKTHYEKYPKFTMIHKDGTYTQSMGKILINSHIDFRISTLERAFDFDFFVLKNLPLPINIDYLAISIIFTEAQRLYNLGYEV